MLGLIAAGCSGDEWVSRSVAGVVWSDDGERVLVSLETWEERPLRESFGTPGALEFRNGTVELWEVAPNGADARLLFGPTSGVVHSAFFMRSAGYVLIPHQPGAHGDVDHASRNLRLPLDGSASSETSFGAFVPSPTGQLVAQATQVEVVGEVELPIEVQLLDGSTLAPRGTAIPTGLVGRTTQLIWLDDERMAVQAIAGSADAKTVAIVHVDGTIEPTPSVLDCWYPSTSSSPWDDEGRLVTAAVTDGGFEIEVTDSGGPGWPERCFPRE